MGITVGEGAPCYLLYVDDVVLVYETKEGLEGRSEMWRSSLKSRGMRISRTQYVKNRRRVDVKVSGWTMYTVEKC